MNSAVKTSFDAIMASVAERGLSLARAWPRSSEHLLLDLRRPDGARIPAQWFADHEVARQTAERTPTAGLRDQLVLHPEGADSKLGRLSEVLAQPGARLVGHRPERRAVVELTSASGARTFMKFVPPSRQAGLLRTTQLAARLPLRTPRVLHHAAADGTVTTSALSGTALPEILGRTGSGPALVSTGAEMARLHGLPIPAGVPLHEAASEERVTTRWAGFAEAYGVMVGPRPGPWPEPPPPERPERPALIHRDLHDGQVFVDLDPERSELGRVGLLDFDLMAVGDPALDLANLIEHLHLRGRQGVLDDPEGAVDNLLVGYQPSVAVTRSLPWYRALARRRLQYVYAFRARDLIT